VSELAPLSRADSSALSFLSDARRAAQLQSCQAACVVVGARAEEAARARGAYILADDPYLYYARLTQLWRAQASGTGVRFAPGVHATAVVHPDARVHESAHIGPHCVVEQGAQVGAHSVLRAGVWLGEGCIIGDRCLIQPGAVIGGDGFGFAPVDGRWEKIEQLGCVRIGHDVEVGANTCIDRGALDDTVIADGVKLDNQIQIGHNTRIGAHTAMAGCVGVAGSADIGAHCTVGGAGMILGHLQIADHVHISAASVVTRSISAPGQYTGFFPLSDKRTWEKNAVGVRQLAQLRERVRALERELKNLGP
jgi:UDP-3-O-[3-hydroxymyristoyl] glucosamine N-acyltransferase